MLMVTFVLLAGLYLFLKILGFMSVFRLLAGGDLKLGSGHRVDEENFPAEFLAAFKTTASELYADGFEYSHVEKRADQFGAISTPQWVMVLRHESCEAYAEISASPVPDALAPQLVSFISFFEKADLVTRNMQPDLVSKSGSAVQIQHIVTADIHKHWQAHLDFLAKWKSELGILHSPDAASYSARLTVMRERECDDLVAGQVFKAVDTGFRLRYRAAVDQVKHIQKQNTLINSFRTKKLAEASQSRSTDISVLETDAYFRLQEWSINSRFSYQIKWLILLVSGIFFFGFVGFAFSWQVALAVLVVLLVHEAGHFFAMRAFGYQDLYMFFIPLGAVVMGHKPDKTPWQEAVVLLAGPVPGIVMATLALVLIPDPPSWIVSLSMVSLVINYMNLLPIPPLDGGKIMQLVVFDRYLWLRVLVKVGSIVAFGASAYAFIDPVLGILASLLMFVAFNDFKIWRLQRATGGKDNEGSSDADYVRHLFRELSGKKILFVTKRSMVKQLLGSSSRKLPNLPVAMSIFVVYIMTATLPLMGGFMALKSDYGHILNLVFQEEHDIVDWDEQIARSESTDDRVTTMLAAFRAKQMEGNQSLSLEYMHQAIRESVSSERIDLQEMVYNDRLRSAVYEDDVVSAEAFYKEYVNWVAGDEARLLTPTYFMTEIFDTKVARTYLNELIVLSLVANDASNVIFGHRQLAFMDKDTGNVAGAMESLQNGLTSLEGMRPEHEAGCSSGAFADALIDVGRQDQAKTLLQECVHMGRGYDKSLALLMSGWLNLANGELAIAEELINEWGVVRTETENQAIEDMELHYGLFHDHVEFAWYDSSIMAWQAELVLAYLRQDAIRFEQVENGLFDSPDSYYTRDEFIEHHRIIIESSRGIAPLVSSLVLQALGVPSLAAATVGD